MIRQRILLQCFDDTSQARFVKNRLDGLRGEIVKMFNAEIETSKGPDIVQVHQRVEIIRDQNDNFSSGFEKTLEVAEKSHWIGNVL